MVGFIKKYKHAWVLLYGIIYVIWFFVLNVMPLDNFIGIEVPLDASIPFCEWFIIPYYIWFLYIPVVIAYFFFTSKSEYYKCTAYLFIGMTICLIIYSIYPNAVFFRPDLDSLGRENVLVELTRIIYKADPGTNVCPSIHCFNSIGVWLALHKSEGMKSHIWIKRGSFFLTVMICFSTVFVKQHSIFDVYMAILLSIIMYFIVYVPNYSKLFNKKIKYMES